MSTPKFSISNNLNVYPTAATKGMIYARFDDYWNYHEDAELIFIAINTNSGFVVTLSNVSDCSDSVIFRHVMEGEKVCDIVSVELDAPTQILSMTTKNTQYIFV